MAHGREEPAYCKPTLHGSPATIGTCFLTDGVIKQYVASWHALKRPFCMLLLCFVSGVQDEDMDVYAVVTGLFEQVFTISREFPYGGGGQTPSGTGSATKTEG